MIKLIEELLKTDNNVLKLNFSNSASAIENKDNTLKQVDGRIKRILRKIKKLRRIKKNTDTIISEYLNECSVSCNKKDFKNILFFVFLFREMVNKIKKDNYTFKKGPAKIIEFANNFFPYLREIKISETFSDNDKLVFVEILIHFAYWLLYNSHTKIKLNLSLLTTNPGNEDKRRCRLKAI